MARAYERILASSAPLKTYGVLWVNTSVNPYTLNMYMNGAWREIGSTDIFKGITSAEIIDELNSLPV